jgi:diguanylate cyclase (GGDEF)-like protein
LPASPVLALQNLHRFELERALSAELVVRARQQAAVALLGQRALAGTDLDALMSEATTLVTQVLDVELAKVLQVQADATLLLRAGAGWPPNLYGRITKLKPGSQAYLALTSDAPVIVEDFNTDRRVRPSAFAQRLGVLSSVVVTISGHGCPYGVLGADTATQRSFSRNDIDFLQSVANVLAAAIDADRVRQELLHQALHDPLTGLPNRALLLDRLEQSLARARRHGNPVTVLFLDVDRFKVINDSLGHTAGDQLLLCIADRLRATMRPSDTVGRFGGDEFVVLSEDALDEDQAILLAEGVAASLMAPATIAGRDIRFTVSTGIVVANMHDTAEALLRDADVAMYRAKERGRARYEVFNASMRELVVDRLETERALQEAIEQGQLRVVYQPEVALRDGRVVAVEALVRWAHPERGLLTPADFMELAEDTGLVVPLDRWVLREACAQVQRCRIEHPSLSDMVLWVNFSARQLADPEVAGVVAHCLRSTGCDPSLLGIEITESVVMEDVAEVRSALAALRQLGVQLAIDDFGTGFSSLSYLRSFPVSVLKVDRSFVAGMVHNDGDRAIVGAVISLAHSLGLSAVAEGVETPQQLGLLREMGCELAQGYLFGRPAEMAVVSPQLACMAELAKPCGPSPPLAGPDPNAAPNVLVCDDDATIRRVYRAAFELEGATVWEAADGDECIAVAHAHHPDLVVLDIFMPGRGGLSALPELVRDLPGLRVVTVSAAATQDIADETRILGAEECFEKTDFLRLIPNVLAGSEPVG